MKKIVGVFIMTLLIANSFVIAFSNATNNKVLPIKEIQNSNNIFYSIKTTSLNIEPPEEWNTTFIRGWGHSVQQTADSGYIITGYKSTLNQKICAIRTVKGIRQEM